MEAPSDPRLSAFAVGRTLEHLFLFSEEKANTLTTRIYDLSQKLLFERQTPLQSLQQVFDTSIPHEEQRDLTHSVRWLLRQGCPLSAENSLPFTEANLVAPQVDLDKDPILLDRHG